MAAFLEVETQQLRQLQGVIDRYKALDDAVFLLQSDLPRLKLMIDRYGGDLTKVMAEFIDANRIFDISDDAWQAFYRSMRRYIETGDLLGRRASREVLLESVVSTWESQVNRTVSTITDNLFARAAGFKAMAQSAAIPAQRLADIQKYEITSVTIEGQQYNYSQLQNIWQQMNDSYGQRDTIQFRNGVNYPLRTYVDARDATTSTEAHRLTTIVEASSNGVYFGAVNKTGTTDSCIFHENEIFYLTEAARQEAQAKWAHIESLKTMKTWDEIKADDTHMGKFGCKHLVRAVAIQFFSEERMTKAIEARPGMPVPEKINERKIFEKETGRKWEYAAPKSKSSYQPIPNRREIEPRYTIA